MDLCEINEDLVYDEWRDSFSHLPKKIQEFIRSMSYRVSNAEAIQMGEEVSEFDDVVFNYVKALIFEEGLEAYAAIDEGSTMQNTFKDARAFAAKNLFAVRL